VTALTPLSSWLNDQPEHIVAVHKAKSVTTQDFLLRVQGWINVLHDQQASRCAVYHSDAFEFLSILFALWQLKCTACIPGDNRPGTVQRLGTHVDSFVGEFADGITAGNSVDSHQADRKRWLTLQPDFIALEIYTSGSTGEPKAITKTILQLEREITVLESLWPGRQECVVLATVSHQHLYGMTFRLFWPFCAGQAFARKLCEYSEDIFHHAKHYAAFSLISSPSHLSRLNTTVNWRELDGRCLYLISSAAPLARQDSLNVGRLLSVPVREIYGSSETGAVAWRVQQECKDEALWQALPEVQLSPDDEGTLCVRSSYLGDIEHLTLPDRVAFDDDGRFKLIGRVDRIVKVEGKRVSLVAMEWLLLECSLIKNARVLTLQRKRVETAVVVQLSEEGELQLGKNGRKLLVKIFKELLREHFEAVVLPRRWRFVEQMPYNSQGKLPMDALQAMFVKESVKLPEIVDEQMIDGEAKIQCFIQKELIYFDGHFDGNPVVAGIVQVHWAEAFGRRMFAFSGRFKSLEVVKFQKIIVPGLIVTITLKYDDASNKLIFQYQSDKGVHSSGRICFG
jgi:acyl-CoA synthetase (AMP-forming)/AMP-acid ligase II/3-hydroxymyristoyl/3-hydroxydecanoyl-(acyl carrier protein) dehydratase